MKKYVVTKMVAEFDDDAPTFDEMLYSHQDKPLVFDTKAEAKKHISAEVKGYRDGGDYVVNDVTRAEKDGVLLVTVHYDNGRAQYQCCAVEM